MIDVLNETEIERVPTGIEGAMPEDDFMITKNAIEMIEQIKEANEVPHEYNLRLGTRSGGCSGMSYTLGFDSEVAENDRMMSIGGLNMVVDNKSLFYLQGITLDFVEGPSGSGFMFNNPFNAHVCGCSSGKGHQDRKSVV